MPRTMAQLLSLVAAGIVTGALVGGSVAFGLCSVVYLVHRQ